MSFTLCLMQSCSTEEALLQNESNIQTVSREQAIQFLQQNPLKVSGNKTSKMTTLSNYDAITLEKITNSDQLLTVIPIPDSDKQQNSRVLLLTVNDTLKSVVFKMYPDVAQSTKEFSGRVLITSMNGDFFKGFRMKNRCIISKFIKKPSTSATNKIESKTTTAYATEPIELQEVIIPARKPVQSLTVAYLYVYSYEIESSSNSLISWGFGGGGGGGGAEPVVEEEDFEDKIDDSELNPCLTQVLLDLKNLKEGKIASLLKHFLVKNQVIIGLLKVIIQNFFPQLDLHHLYTMLQASRQFQHSILFPFQMRRIYPGRELSCMREYMLILYHFSQMI